MGQLPFAWNRSFPLREGQPGARAAALPFCRISLNLASSPPEKRPFFVGCLFVDQFHTLGRVLDVLRGTSNREKLKKSFAQNSQNTAVVHRFSPLHGIPELHHDFFSGKRRKSKF